MLVAIVHHRTGVQRIGGIHRSLGWFDIGTQLPEGADMSLLQKVLPFDGNRPPSAVANLVAFLASEDAVHINGIDIRIDGGLMA